MKKLELSKLKMYTVGPSVYHSCPSFLKLTSMAAFGRSGKRSGKGSNDDDGDDGIPDDCTVSADWKVKETYDTNKELKATNEILVDRIKVHTKDDAILARRIITTLTKENKALRVEANKTEDKVATKELELAQVNAKLEGAEAEIETMKVLAIKAENEMVALKDEHFGLQKVLAHHIGVQKFEMGRVMKEMKGCEEFLNRCKAPFQT
jgi:hypothetical protein